MVTFGGDAEVAEGILNATGGTVGLLGLGDAVEKAPGAFEGVAEVPGGIAACVITVSAESSVAILTSHC